MESLTNTRSRDVRPQTSGATASSKAVSVQRSGVADEERTSSEPVEGRLSESSCPNTNCPDCGGADVERSEEGAYYCTSCGLVLTGYPIERSEPGWTSPENRRLGPPTDLSHESVGTTISNLPGSTVSYRLRRYNDRIDYSTQALKAGLHEVRSLCAAGDFPRNTREEAAYLYRRASKADLLQGRSREGIAAACVYVAARQLDQPIALDDVANLSPVEKQRISKDFRTVMRELNIGIRPPQPRQFVARIAAEAGVSYRVQRRATELLEEAKAAGDLVGQNPCGVAAAAIYAAAEQCEESLTQATVAEAAGVSTVTISRQVQQFRD